MYTNYLDPIEQNIDTASRAIEGDQYHLRIQRGSVTLNLTANTEKDQTIAFSPIFTPGTTPDIKLTLYSVGSITAKINVVADSNTTTNQQFTLKAYSDTTQTITVGWEATGTAE